MTLARTAAMLAFVVATACCAPLLQMDPMLRGTIVAVGSGSLDVRHKSGRIVRVQIGPGTTVESGARPGTAPSLRPGVRITITLDESSSPFVARRVRVFGDRR